MSDLLPPPDFFSDPYRYIYQARDILWEVRMAVVAIVLLTIGGTCLVCSFVYRKVVADLRERVRLRDDQIAQLEKRLATFLTSSEVAAPTPTGVFEIEASEPALLWVTQNREEVPVHPNTSKPVGAILRLRVWVTITTVPARAIDIVELEVVRKRVAPVTGSWEPGRLPRSPYGRYWHFDLPTIPSGSHAAKLIAYSGDVDKPSLSFDIEVPRGTE